MVSFDHRDAGTADELWLAAPQWSKTAALNLDGVDRLVVLAAHPDDESLGAAGLVAAAHAAGISVTVIISTAGERSHPDSPTHSPEQLAALRRAEVVRAVDAVAPAARLVLAGLPDGSLREHVAELTALVESSLVGGRSTLVAATWRDDGHPDHRAAGDAAAEAVRRAAGARLLEYPIWAWHWAIPESPDWPWHRVRRFELDGPSMRAKNAALARHGSQLESLSPAVGDEAIVSEGFALNFRRDFETFFVAERPASHGTDAESTEPESTEPESLARSYFDSFYEGRRDPWGFETRWYEERKRALTMASLQRRLGARGRLIDRRPDRRARRALRRPAGH
jgi:LmbE family N-acetylglucosaminyl deacetylase